MDQVALGMDGEKEIGIDLTCHEKTLWNKGRFYILLGVQVNYEYMFIKIHKIIYAKSVHCVEFTLHLHDAKENCNKNLC